MLHTGTVHSVSWKKNALCFIDGFKRNNWGFILMDGVSTWLCFKFLFLYVADDNCTYLFILLQYDLKWAHVLF